MRCKWCGKETDTSFCSNKCTAESDSYNGISRAERSDINAKQDAAAKNSGIVIIVCVFLFSFVYWGIPSGLFTFKQTGASSERKNRSTYSRKVPSNNAAQQGNPRSGQPMEAFRCKRCKKESVWVYIGTKPEPGICISNGGHNWVPNWDHSN